MNDDKVCFLLLDFETGGLRPHRDIYNTRSEERGSPILSYGAILLDENLALIDHSQGLVQPAIFDSFGSMLTITPEALEVNGLQPSECHQKGIKLPDMLEKLDLVCKRAGDSPIILTGSNPEFDRGFWAEATRICHLEDKLSFGDDYKGQIKDYKIPRAVRRRALDTYELNFQYLLKQGYSMRFASDNSGLPKFMKVLNLPHNAHDAFGDCMAVWAALWLHLKGEIPNADSGIGIPNDGVKSGTA